MRIWDGLDRFRIRIYDPERFGLGSMLVQFMAWDGSVSDLIESGLD